MDAALLSERPFWRRSLARYHPHPLPLGQTCLDGSVTPPWWLERTQRLSIAASVQAFPMSFVAFLRDRGLEHSVNLLIGIRYMLFAFSALYHRCKCTGHIWSLVNYRSIYISLKQLAEQHIT